MKTERGHVFEEFKKYYKSYSAATLSSPTKHSRAARLLLGKGSIMWCPPTFWELDPNAAPPQVSALHRGSKDEAAPCDAHACDPNPSIAAAAQGETAAPQSPMGCKALKPKLGKLGCWWNQASEQTLTLMDVQGDGRQLCRSLLSVFL